MEKKSEEIRLCTKRCITMLEIKEHTVLKCVTNAELKRKQEEKGINVHRNKGNLIIGECLQK